MSYLNLDLILQIYNDGPASRQPKVKTSDLAWSMLGLTTSKSRTMPFCLAPGETITVSSTQRSISFNGSTTFAITALAGGVMRISASLGQRTARAVDSSLAYDLTRTGDVMRLTAPSGTPAALDAISVGDFIRFAAGYQIYNQGEFMVLSRGAGYVEFQNALGIAEPGIVGTLSSYSSGPVQRGDKVDISSPAFAFPNQGSFAVLEVSDSYIDVLNPKAFPQTVSGITTGVAVYPSASKWMLVACDRRVILGLNGASPAGIEVEPQVEGDLNKFPGLFLKRGKVFEVQIQNPGSTQAEGFLVLSE